MNMGIVVLDYIGNMVVGQRVQHPTSLCLHGPMRGFYRINFWLPVSFLGGAKPKPPELTDLTVLMIGQIY